MSRGAAGIRRRTGDASARPGAQPRGTLSGTGSGSESWRAKTWHGSSARGGGGGYDPNGASAVATARTRQTFLAGNLPAVPQVWYIGVGASGSGNGLPARRRSHAAYQDQGG